MVMWVIIEAHVKEESGCDQYFSNQYGLISFFQSLLKGGGVHECVCKCERENGGRG